MPTKKTEKVEFVPGRIVLDTGLCGFFLVLLGLFWFGVNYGLLIDWRIAGPFLLILLGLLCIFKSMSMGRGCCC